MRLIIGKIGYWLKKPCTIKITRFRLRKKYIELTLMPDLDAVFIPGEYKFRLKKDKFGNVTGIVIYSSILP